MIPRQEAKEMEALTAVRLTAEDRENNNINHVPSMHLHCPVNQLAPVMSSDTIIRAH